MNLFELIAYEMNELLIPEILMTIAIIAWGLWTHRLDKKGHFEDKETSPKSH